MKSTIIFILAVTVFLVTGCVKDVNPSDAITTETLISSPEGLKNAVNGSYSLLKDHIAFNGSQDDNLMYLRQYFQLSDFASDDIVNGQVTEDPLWYSFTLDHTPTQTNTRYYWYISYKIINNANAVIEAGEKITDADASIKQLIGECYFLRALAHFNLVKLFARPYAQDPSAPGVILRTSLSDPAQKARSTVAEVYQQVITDAEKAAELMTAPRGNGYASQEAAYALLSRVYLYMENNDKTIEYSDKVINSGRFTLTDSAAYRTLFSNAKGSSETIFCVAFTSGTDDYGKFGSIASMVYSDGNSGWGEEFASASLRELMGAHPEDVRWSYIIPLEDDNGDIEKKNGIETYYISKFSFQDGSPTLSSPILFRLAEMYLNKAEAEAKAGNTAESLDELDVIRNNRGLSGSLYNKTLPAGKTALDVVLDERRIELAFEGHRSFDVFRNKLSMNRDYWGYHLPGLQESDIDLSKKPSGYPNIVTNFDDPRVVYYIPIDEIQSNPLCVQNP